MATTTGRLSTEDDLRNTPDDGIYELVDGDIRVSPGGCRHSTITMALAARLARFVRRGKLGDVFGPNTGHRLPSGNVRCPDASFVAAGRWPSDRDPNDFVSVPPDLVVEVLSPKDRPRWILDKVGEYLEAGVRLIWVIDPQERRATVYRSLTNVGHLGPENAIDGEDVVPGFRCRLGDVLV